MFGIGGWEGWMELRVDTRCAKTWNYKYARQQINEHKLIADTIYMQLLSPFIYTVSRKTWQKYELQSLCRT